MYGIINRGRYQWLMLSLSMGCLLLARCGYTHVQKRKEPRGAMHLLGCGCALPVQLDFRVVRGAQHGNEHADTVEWRHRDIEEHDAEEDGEALLQVAAYRDSKGASDLVRLERDNVERERHDAVTDNREEELPVEDTLSDSDLEAGELAACVGVKQALSCGERRHAKENLHGG